MLSVGYRWRYRLKPSPGLENTLTELLIKELSLSVIFLWLSVKALYDKGRNLKNLLRLSQEARGYFTAPIGVWGSPPI